MSIEAKQITYRQAEIVDSFVAELEKHMFELAEGSVHDKYTIQDFASLLFIHPIHLTNVIKNATGRTPCSFYKESLINTAKELLKNPSLPISVIAYNLTFDTSNFSKFFKRTTGITPSQYRSSLSTISRKS